MWVNAHGQLKLAPKNRSPRRLVCRGQRRRRHTGAFGLWFQTLDVVGAPGCPVPGLPFAMRRTPWFPRV